MTSSPGDSTVFLTLEEAQELMEEYGGAKDGPFYVRYMLLRFGDGAVNSRHRLSHYEALQTLPIPVSTTDISRLRAAGVPLTELMDASEKVIEFVGAVEQRDLLAEYVDNRCLLNLSHKEAVQQMTD